MDKKIAIQAALFQQMLASNNTSITTSTLLAAILAYAQRELVDTTVILVWLSLIVIIALSRAILSFSYRRYPLDKDASPDERLLRFRLGVLAVGLVWGAAGVVMYPPNDPSHQMFLFFMLAGLTAGGVVSYASDLVSAIGFSILALVPAIIRLFASGDNLSMAMGMAGMLYLGFMIVILRYMNRNVRENIILRLDAVDREEAARANEERYRLLLKYSPVGIMHYDTHLTITYCNDVFAEKVHNCREHLIGLDIKSLKDQSVLPAMRKALDGEPGYYNGYYTASFSEFSFWITMTCAPSLDGTGKIVGGVCIVQDVTALHEFHQQLNSMAEGVYGVDTNGQCKYVNRAFLRILGYEHANEIIGKNTHELIHHSYPDGSLYPDSECKLYEAFRKNKAIHITNEVFWKKDGTAVPVEYWSQPVMEEGVMRGAVVTFIDITERKLVEEEIHNLAFYDTLTLLPNRALVLDRLNLFLIEAKRYNNRLTVLFMDLDDFKKINDSMGHLVGDNLLIQVAKRLRDTVREGDTVGRLGGDEFVILLASANDLNDIQHVANNLLNCFKDSFQLDGRDFIVTASLGIAIYPEDGQTGTELLRSADTAMYHAKAQGRNTCCFFTNEMNQAVSRRLMIEEQLHKALERDEFHVCYQPLVDAKTRKIIKAEALLRWNNRELGAVSPDEFIPATEQSGLIDQLGRYVISQALTCAAQMTRLLERDFKVSVNLSPRQFRDLELVPFIKDTLQQNCITGKHLELEITEGVLMQERSNVDEALSVISQMGISIAMDDFGTGYSSLSQLRSYHFDVLKIDQSFIRDITINTDDRLMVNSVIAMAHSLGLEVVGEGVETEEQLEQLCEQHCDMVQGYLLSPPVRPDELSRLLM
jgi:diguanylate cyclase (GGDEF)-like protein/PAS domain S-box-containing protein